MSEVDITNKVNITNRVNIIKRVDITPGFILLLTAAVVISGFRLATLVIVAAAVHELGHVAAIILCGGRVTGLRLGAAGAELNFDGRFSYLRDAAAALAGPAAGAAFTALSVFAGRAFGLDVLLELSAVSLVYTLFNLIPLGDMDGGRAVHALVCLVFGPRSAELVSLVLDVSCSVLALFVGIYVLVACKGNATALICAVFVINGCCKRRGFIV